MIAMLDKPLRVAMTGDDVTEDLQAGDAGDVADHQRQLHVHLYQRRFLVVVRSVSGDGTLRMPARTTAVMRLSVMGRAPLPSALPALAADAFLSGPSANSCHLLTRAVVQFLQRASSTLPRNRRLCSKKASSQNRSRVARLRHTAAAWHLRQSSSIGFARPFGRGTTAGAPRRRMSAGSAVSFCSTTNVIHPRWAHPRSAHISRGLRNRSG